MFIKVLPLDISFSSEALTYYAKEEQKKYLFVGGIVSVPIKNRISLGVISEITKTQDDIHGEVKSIIEVLCSFPLLSEYQINLIFQISKKYYIAVHKVLNLFLPKFILNRLEKNAFLDILEIEKVDFSKEKSFKTKKTLIHNINLIPLKDVLEKNIGGIEDAVLIFGDDFSIDSFLQKNQKYKKDALIFRNSDSYSKKYKNYLDILKKKKNILIGTRKLLQYNLGAYKKIIYIEDSMIRYNYNQFEKYKNLDILGFMADQNIFDTYFISIIPSIELFYLSKKNNYTYKAL